MEAGSMKQEARSRKHEAGSKKLMADRLLMEIQLLNMARNLKLETWNSEPET
jgi:hypothetical protein